RYHFDELPIILRPYQQPQPPWWYPGNIVAAAAGGMTCIGGGPIPLSARQVAAYRAACADGGVEGTTIGGICSVYVAPTDDEGVGRGRSACGGVTDPSP